MDLHSIEDLMEDQSQFKDNVLQQVSKNLTTDHVNRFASYNSSRRKEKNKLDSYRKGPAPIEECDQLRKSIAKATYGTLDSDLEDLDFEDVRIQNANIPNLYHRVRKSKNEAGHNLASCRALIVYFSKLAKTKDDDEVIDLNFFYSLLESGADINFPDKHGQTVLHEISRGWHPDVAKFAIENGANVNKADLFGRTPLHLAAAVDYDDMVQFLVDNGADLGATTKGENQTPMHYAAKNNASASLKVMLNMGGRINDRDYKRRTPLFVAAESARAEAARFLIERGAPAGVYDSAGTPCLSLMIEKMPQIAIEAVEQFHAIDLAFRKHYYYLSFLERDPKFLIDFIPKKKSERKELKERKKAEKKLMKEKGEKIKKKAKTYAKTPLEVIVQYDQLDLIMHPVFQRLLHVKWNLFGKLGSAKLLTLNFIYTMIWTILGIMIPRGNDSFYAPISSNWWRLVLEIFGVGMTGYFIFAEISQLRSTEKKYNCWRQWQTQHMEKDLQYCHPRWPEEEQYLRSELVQIKSYQRTYFRDPWNIFEWIAYIVILILVFTRVAAVVSPSAKAREVHMKFYAVGLIVIWLRFMRPCRVFRTLGPFIAILGSVIADTMKFAFLFFEFFVPYTVAFWIIFGGSINGAAMGEYGVNWEKFNDLTFSVFCMTIMGPFDMEGLVITDRLMTQVLCGTYFALAGVVCMNLYIALLSDTFARVYAQANANAVMQQAKCIITLEAKLDKFRRSKFGHYMQDECSPQEVYSRDENNDDGDDQDYMFDKISRQIMNRINELEESMINKLTGRDHHGGGGNRRSTDFDEERGSSKRMSILPSRENDMLKFVREQSYQNKQISQDISNLVKSFKNIESILLKQNPNLSITMPSNSSQSILNKQTASLASLQSIRPLNSAAETTLKDNVQAASQTLPRNASLQPNNFEKSKSQTLPRKGGKTGKGLDEVLSVAMGPLLSPETLKRVTEHNVDDKRKAFTRNNGDRSSRQSTNGQFLSRSMDRESLKNELYPTQHADDSALALNEMKEQLEKLQRLQEMNNQQHPPLSRSESMFASQYQNNKQTSLYQNQQQNQPRQSDRYDAQTPNGNNYPSQNNVQYAQYPSNQTNQPLQTSERQQHFDYRNQPREEPGRRRKENAHSVYEDEYENETVFQRTLDSSDFQYKQLPNESRSKKTDYPNDESGRSSRSSLIPSSSLYDSNDDDSTTSSTKRRRRRRRKNKSKKEVAHLQQIPMAHLPPQGMQVTTQQMPHQINNGEILKMPQERISSNLNQGYPPQQVSQPNPQQHHNQYYGDNRKTQQLYPPNNITNNAPTHHPYPPESYPQQQAYPASVPSYPPHKDLGVQYAQPNGYMLSDQYPHL